MPNKAATLAKIAEAPWPINVKWCPILKHRPDLQKLLKLGFIHRVRDGGGRRHPKNRTSAKRTTYLHITEAGSRWLAWHQKENASN